VGCGSSVSSGCGAGVVVVQQWMGHRPGPLGNGVHLEQAGGTGKENGRVATWYGPRSSVSSGCGGSIAGPSYLVNPSLLPAPRVPRYLHAMRVLSHVERC
jgi:hypothetical protein